MDFQLSDGHVALRQLRPNDAPALLAAIKESQPELGRWLTNLRQTTQVEQVAAYIAQQPQLWAEGNAYNCLIVDAHNERPLGGCGLNRLHPYHRFANMYYWVRASAKGRGVAAAAARLLASYGLAQLDLRRVEIVVDVENIASARAAEHAGAQREGMLRARLATPEGQRDAYVYSLVAADLGLLER